MAGSSNMARRPMCGAIPRRLSSRNSWRLDLKPSNGFGDGFRDPDAIDCRGKNAAGKAGAFAGGIKAGRIEALEVLAALDADGAGGAGLHPRQHRIRTI